jgi:hypothetical protein
VAAPVMPAQDRAAELEVIGGTRVALAVWVWVRENRASFKVDDGSFGDETLLAVVFLFEDS